MSKLLPPSWCPNWLPLSKLLMCVCPSRLAFSPRTRPGPSAHHRLPGLTDCQMGQQAGNVPECILSGAPIPSTAPCKMALWDCQEGLPLSGHSASEKHFPPQGHLAWRHRCCKGDGRGFPFVSGGGGSRRSQGAGFWATSRGVQYLIAAMLIVLAEMTLQTLS